MPFEQCLGAAQQVLHRCGDREADAPFDQPFEQRLEVGTTWQLSWQVFIPHGFHHERSP